MYICIVIFNHADGEDQHDRKLTWIHICIHPSWHWHMCRHTRSHLAMSLLLCAEHPCRNKHCNLDKERNRQCYWCIDANYKDESIHLLSIKIAELKEHFLKLLIGQGKLLFSNQYWFFVILKLPPDDVNGLLEPGLTSLEP